MREVFERYRGSYSHHAQQVFVVRCSKRQMQGCRRSLPCPGFIQHPASNFSSQRLVLLTDSYPRLDSLVLLNNVNLASGRSKLLDFPVSYPSSLCTSEGLVGGRTYLILQLFLLDVSPTSPHLCNVFLMIDSLFIFFIITMILIGDLTSQWNPGRQDSANSSERGNA